MLRVSGLSKSYGLVPALTDVSFDADSNDIICILGPSGSGKSTLLSVISGLTSADSGAVLLDGENILEKPPEKRQVGLVPQEYALFSHLSVFDNVAFGLRVRRRSREDIQSKVSDLLARLDIAEFSTRKVDQLSGGQRQRVAIGRALATEPKILLMDEPLANLDPGLRKSLEDELSSIQQSINIPFLFVTHSQDEALNLATKVALLRDGRLMEFGSSKSVYYQPSTMFGAEFLGTSNIIPARTLSPSGGGGQVASPFGTVFSDFQEIGEAAGSIIIRAEDISVFTSDVVDSDSGDEDLVVSKGSVIRCRRRLYLMELEIKVGDFSIIALVDGRKVINVGDDVWVKIRKSHVHVIYESI